MTDKLEPCPFCGDAAEIFLTARGEDAVFLLAAGCVNSACPAQPVSTGDTADAAIRLWNTRKQKEPTK